MRRFILTKKTVGIVGIGSLTTEFFNSLINSDAGHNLMSQTENFLFYHTNKTPEEITQSEKYKKLEEILETKIDDKSISLSPASNLKSFYLDSSVILYLAGGGFYDNNLKEGRTDSTSNFIYKKILELEEKGFFVKDSLNPFSRIEQELPHNLSLVVNFSKQLKPYSEIFQPPTPIVMGANGPSICSSVMSSICPELTDYIVGFTSVDESRLKKLFNKEIEELKQASGLKNITLKVGVKGNHDHMMIPILYVNSQGNQEDLNHIFSSINYQGMFKRMQSKLVNYFGHYSKKGINLKKEAAESLVNLTNSILNSLGKPLTPVSGIYNAVFHPLDNEYHGVNIGLNQGLFFVDKHNIVNGKFIKDDSNDLAVDVLAQEKFEACKIDHLKLYLELMEERKVEHVKDIKSLPERLNHSLQSPQIKNNPLFAIPNKRKVVVAKETGGTFVELKQLPLDHKTSYLNGMVLDGSVKYLLTGHKKSIGVINLEHNDETRKVRFNVKSQGGSFNYVGKLGNFLVGSHPSWGICRINIEDFYSGNKLIEDSNLKNYSLTRHLAGNTIAVDLNNDELFVAQANELFSYDNAFNLTGSWNVSEKITSIACGHQRLFVGTNEGRILSLKGDYETINLGPNISITNLSLDNQKLAFNTYNHSMNTFGGLIYIKNLEEQESLRRFETQASWLKLNQGKLYVNSTMRGFLRKDIDTGKNITELYLPKIGEVSTIII